MKKIKRNYHTHTYRCGHAIGTEEEMVQAAINLGIVELGISDHVFLPGVNSPKIRGKYEYLDDYVNAIKASQTKHPEIKLHIGFEAEYDPQFLGYYKDLLESHKIDYLILGQHQFFNEKKEPVWYAGFEDKSKAISLYKEAVINGIRSGLFSYVAHPDLIMLYFGLWNDEVIDALTSIAKEAKKYDIPLELNMGPSRWDHKNIVGGEVEFTYPYPKFWDIVKEIGNKAIIGADVHAPDEFASSDYEWAYKFLHDCGIKKIVDKIELYDDLKKRFN